MSKGIKELEKDKNNKEFSQLVHNYYKLAAMRIMQEIREKHDIPEFEIPTLVLAIFGRMLNEGCYSVGANISEDYPITNFFSKEHLLNLVHVLNGKPLSHINRKDLNKSVQDDLEEFKKFIEKNAQDFKL